MRFLILLLLWAAGLSGCQSTPTIKFEGASSGTKKITASLVELGDTQSTGEPIGPLPVEIEVEKLTGKALRLSAPGFDDQFWIAPANLSESNNVKIKLKQRLEGNKEIPALIARASVLLLRSYEALAEGDFELAKRLADQSDGVFNLGPGATMVKAIATWQEGDGRKAEAMIKEADAIYPDTPELDELLSAFKKDE